MLPELIDGRTIFLQENEQIKRAYLVSDETKHYYCSINTIKDSPDGEIVSYFSKNSQSPDHRHPNVHDPEWIRTDLLKFY